HLSLVCYFSTRTSTTGICTLSLHDALPICGRLVYSFVGMKSKEVVVGSKSIINITLESNIVLQEAVTTDALGIRKREARADMARSEEHTSELQSRENLVCRLLLEKKENIEL